MGKTCELCNDRATLYCCADGADLCRSCDAKVHGANFLVARHIRSLLCSICSGETECHTSGPRPPPLSRLCSHCHPARVEEATQNEPLILEHNDDSEHLSGPGCTAAISYPSQESHTDAHSSVEDDNVVRKCVPDGSRSGKERFGGCRVVHSKRTRALGHSRRLSVKRSKKRSSSPVSVISADILSWEHDDGGKEQIGWMSLLHS